jgi:hypothetical protein
VRKTGGIVASMAVNATHPDYEASLPVWSRARDVLAGEDAVKAAGEKYLPKLDSQDDEEYAAYKNRASFFGATARTLEEYLDLIFRRAPVTKLPDSEIVRAFAEDCNRWGTSFVRYARRVVSEVLSVGRGGSLVLEGEASGRPWVSLWRAEDILNWSVARVGGRAVLAGVVLRDGEQLRVLQLVGSECFQQVWAEVDGTWSVAERVSLKRDSTPLPFIPFVFHGPRNSRPEPDRLPLADIIAANLDHYRLDADYKHGLHFAALPTAWVSGFDKAAPLRIGSSTAWVSDVPGASAGFLEFSGSGLGHIERAMEKVEHRMALLGARMLEGTAESSVSVGDGQLCGLGSIVASLNESLTKVLQLAQWWTVGGDLDALSGKATFAMNTDLGARAMGGEEITAVVAAWRAGAISRETMLERLKRGEVLPDGRSVGEEKALIHGKAGAPR